MVPSLLLVIAGAFRCNYYYCPPSLRCVPLIFAIDVPIYDLNKNRWLFVEINSKVSSYGSKHSINSKGQVMTSALSAEVVGPTTNDMQLLTKIFRERGRDSCYSSISCIRFDRH